MFCVGEFADRGEQYSLGSCRASQDHVRDACHTQSHGKGQWLMSAKAQIPPCRFCDKVFMSCVCNFHQNVLVDFIPDFVADFSCALSWTKFHQSDTDGFITDLLWTLV